MKKNICTAFLYFFCLVGLVMSPAKNSFANNLQIDNFGVVETNEASNYITFTGDISWENSWRNITNYDAVWVFLKYSLDAGTTWHHASMGSFGFNPDGFTAPANFEILVPADEGGFFIQRSDLSSGDVQAENVRFVWDYAQDGLTDEQAMASNTVNKIFGIEMVHIPEGSFYVGDHNSSSDYRLKEGSSDNDPWYVQNENAITTTNSSADGFYYQGTGASGENSSGDIFIIPTSFPKGYKSFYQMKYELTEGQWVSFFNTLTTAGKQNRDITSAQVGGKNSDLVVTRNTISWDSTLPASEAATSRSDRPVSYISWVDLMAYADWAALRPMTELEFEKSARGIDIVAKANEFSWGNTTITGAVATGIYPNSEENGTEQIFDGLANINNNSLSWTSGDGRVGGSADSQKGPLRAGIFAESSTNRTTSGAGFYGSMELSGNLYEMVVTIGRSQGRQFLGSHGDGELSVMSSYEANATNIDWPGIDQIDSARGVVDSVGSGFRGGDFQSSSSKHFQISNRTYAAKDPDSAGLKRRYDVSLGIFHGGRLVRSAPQF